MFLMWCCVSDAGTGRVGVMVRPQGLDCAAHFCHSEPRSDETADSKGSHFKHISFIRCSDNAFLLPLQLADYVVFSPPGEAKVLGSVHVCMHVYPCLCTVYVKYAHAC